MSILDLADVAEGLPYPLGLKLQAIRAGARARYEGEAAPDLPFLIAAFGGLCLRLCSLVAVHAYVVTVGAVDNDLNRLIVDKLRSPTDGNWRDVVNQLRARVSRADARAARFYAWLDAPGRVPSSGAGWEMPGYCVTAALPKDNEVKTVDAVLGKLVTFRNSLMHGNVPSREDLDLALLYVEAVARGAERALHHTTLQVRSGDRAWMVMGHVPQPFAPAPMDLADEVPTLVFEPDPAASSDAPRLEPLPLAPLLRFRPGATVGVDSVGDSVGVNIDELYFVNAAALARLQYVGFRAGAHADGKELGTYEAFKAFWERIPVTPSPKDPVLLYDDLAAYHAQFFVGRGEVLDEIEGALVSAEAEGRYVELRALAGMGKSAILAMLYARQLPAISAHGSLSGKNRTSPSAPRHVAGAPAAAPLPGAWAFHFCAQTDGREYALVALRSVMAQLCDQAGLDRDAWLVNDLKELKEQMLPSLLAKVAEVCGTVVVVLDALDESTGSDEDALAGCLSESLPNGVTVLISWRVDAQNRAGRVDRQLSRISADLRVRLRTADPLAGLAREHVAVMLERIAGAAGLGSASKATLDAVWTAATTDTAAADPFFLRFVSEGVRDGRVDLSRAETIPASLEDAFEGQWLALPTEPNFLAQRMLLLLGILREYGDDELIAEFISQDPAHGQTVTAQDIALVRQSLGKLLVYDGDRYGLFHDRFRRFLVGEQKDPIAEALGEV
jgi:hypothetical protein